MQDHQTIFAVHRDTANVHLHVVVNRVHPRLLRVADPHNGFDALAGHRAICRIEHLHGWRSESNALYRMSDSGPVLTRLVKGAPRSVSSRAQSVEAISGQASAQRLAIERCGPAMGGAKSWGELHAALALLGAKFEPKGSGAVIYIGSVGVKASTAGRECSFHALEKRLGAFIAASSAEVRISRVEPEPLQASAGWALFASQKRVWQTARKAERFGLKSTHDLQLEQHVEQCRVRRSRLSAQSWKGRGAEMNAARSLLAADLAKDRAEISERQRLERARLARDLKVFPGYEQWLRNGGMHNEAEAYRYRHGEAVRAIGFGSNAGLEVPRVVDIRDYQGRITNVGVAYFRPSESHPDPASTRSIRVLRGRVARLGLSACSCSTATASSRFFVGRCCGDALFCTAATALATPRA